MFLARDIHKNILTRNLILYKANENKTVVLSTKPNLIILCLTPLKAGF